MFLRFVRGGGGLLVHFFSHCILDVFSFQFGHVNSWRRSVARVKLPLVRGRRVTRRSGGGGSPTSFFLAVPGIALFAKDAFAALTVVAAAREVAARLVAPVRGGGRVNVLHLDC
jgi:hypothetical protein